MASVKKKINVIWGFGSSRNVVGSWSAARLQVITTAPFQMALPVQKSTAVLWDMTVNVQKNTLALNEILSYQPVNKIVRSPFAILDSQPALTLLSDVKFEKL